MKKEIEDGDQNIEKKFENEDLKLAIEIQEDK